MRKNDRIRLKITDIGIHGEGIGKADGFPFFVKNALPGDEAEAIVTKVKKSYGYAKALKILSPSPDRVQPPCPHAQACGGCQLQALSYENQLAFKQHMVRERLIRIGGFDPETVDQVLEPIRGMTDPWRFRNKAQYPVAEVADTRRGRSAQSRAAAGFYAGRTHHLVEVEDCLLEPGVNARIVAAVLEYVNRSGLSVYDEESGTGILRHILIRHGITTKEILLCLIVRKYREQDWRGLVQNLDQKGLLADGHIVSLGFSVQPDRNNVIMGDKYIPVYGEPYITDRIGDVSFRISPQSFYQVNPAQMKVLYDLTRECAGLTGKETVWDLYCGIGTIGLYMAHQAARVIGVETVPEAVRNARENARINGIDNADFYEGKAEEIFAGLAAGGAAAEGDPPGGQGITAHSGHVVIVDPPRKGCDAGLLNAIAGFGPERIVYVSCDPATLARDLKILCGKGFELERVIPVDQFCHSVHVETVVLLSRSK